MIYRMWRAVKTTKMTGASKVVKTMWRQKKKVKSMIPLLSLPR